MCKTFCAGVWQLYAKNFAFYTGRCGNIFLVERQGVRLTRVVELDSDDAISGVHAHQVMHADEHAHTWTYTTLTFQHSQHSVHVFTKVFHLWVIFHSNDHFTHCHQGFLGASSPQAIVEDLIPIRAPCDPYLITARNYSLTFKFCHNCTGIHISDESVSEAVKNLFRCTERKELLNIACQFLMHIVGPPCAHFQKDQWCVVRQG